ncbi:MAG: M16 family metallopeptidase [Alphaproteobacteria bacterium]
MTLAAAVTEANAVNIQSVTSAGGIKAWLVEDYTVPIVTVNIAFSGGSAQDGADSPGLANFLSGMLDEGAGELDSKAFQTRLQDLNIDLSFDSGRDAFYGNLRSLQTNRDDAFELMRLALTAPRFDDEPVARIRGQILSSLKRSETDPGDIAQKAWANAMFAGHPYGRPSTGTADSVAAISADDLRAFHKRTLARDNLHVAVVGAIDAQELGTALDAMFGALPDHADLVPVADITPQAGARVHKTLDVPQTTIRVGGASIKRDDPDFIPAYLANHILGGGSFSSRLYKEIREERGLAYSVGTGLAAFDHAGAYVGAAATRADAAKLAIELMTGQIREFAENGPTDKELASAISYLTGNYALRFDASRKIARQLIGIQLDKLGIDYVDKRNDLVRAVSADDVRRAAKRVFGGPITVITVGPDQDDS